jgi:hypothetical protein
MNAFRKPFVGSITASVLTYETYEFLH